VKVVGELQRKRTLAASRGFLAAARLSCFTVNVYFVVVTYFPVCFDDLNHTHGKVRR